MQGAASAQRQVGSRLKFSQYDWAAFTAQEYPVEIVPKFNMAAVQGSSAVYGPFSTNQALDVPLWLALFLRNANTCTVTPPDILDLAFLHEVLRRDRDDSQTYQPLPYHFFEVVSLLTGAAREDIPNITEVIRLVAEIEATRRSKLFQGMCGFKDINVPMLKMTNLVSFEVEFLRSTLAPTVTVADTMDDASRTKDAAPLVEVAGGGYPSQLTPARTSTGTSGGIDGSTGAAGLSTGTGTIGRPSTEVGGDDPFATDSVVVSQQLNYEGLSQNTDLTSVAATSVTATTTTAPAPKKRRTLRQQ